jgi:hypothetical protein
VQIVATCTTRKQTETNPDSKKPNSPQVVVVYSNHPTTNKTKNKHTKKDREKTLNCKICAREAEKEGFCPLHLKAYGNLVSRYELWRKALNISWKEYLSQVAENSSTGDWVKEVAKYQLENGET